MSLTFLLIGHRTSGKTTLGRLLAGRLERRFVDIDALLEEETGKPAAQLVFEDERLFRSMEESRLQSALSEYGGGVIAAGGGLLNVPDGVCAVWVDREGWEESAGELRTRLRPDMSLADEIAWMKNTREAAYAEAGHLRLHIARGASEEDAAGLLCAIAGLAEAASGSPAMNKSWILASSPERLSRCISDCRLFGLAGVEIRSDVFTSLPDSSVPLLASLRTGDERFLTQAGSAAAFDCDVKYADRIDLSDLEPRPLIVSVHVQDVDQEYFDAMTHAGNRLTDRFPEWKKHLLYKFAPVVKSWVELRFAHELCRVFRKKGGLVSFIPQGKRWDWMRAFRLWSWNELNYVHTGCVETAGMPPTISCFIPHAAGPQPEAMCAVIGNPVDESIGDVWHRHLSLKRDGGKLGYLKIPIPPHELEHALYFLLKLNLHGLSVTSPFKQAVIHSNFVTSNAGLSSGNTLTLRDGGWSLTDTDRFGMAATLADLENSGIEPGPTAVFGEGGASRTVIDTLLERGWTPVRQTGARRGWGELRKHAYTLVVNASGPGARAHDDPPATRAWLDLHYSSIEKIPSGVEQYRNGFAFYKAQAARQRFDWGFETGDEKPHGE